MRGDRESLVLDAGIRYLDVKKALKFYVKDLAGVLVTHRHLDHNGFAYQFEQDGIQVVRSYETEGGFDSVRIGSFDIRSFPCVHDCPCVGYLIEHKDLGRMLYATDTEYIRYRFKALNTILIEMNYSDEYIDRNAAKFSHTKQGHLEKQTTLDFIRKNMSRDLRHIILCHLSADGSDSNEFKNAVREIVPPWVKVDVAVKGGIVDLREIPF